MEILFLTISHLLVFVCGLFLNKYINSNPVKNSIKKIVSKKAEFINPVNPIDEVDLTEEQ